MQNSPTCRQCHVNVPLKLTPRRTATLSYAGYGLGCKDSRMAPITVTAFALEAQAGTSCQPLGRLIDEASEDSSAPVARISSGCKAASHTRAQPMKVQMHVG